MFDLPIAVINSISNSTNRPNDIALNHLELRKRKEYKLIENAVISAICVNRFEAKTSLVEFSFKGIPLSNSIEKSFSVFIPSKVSNVFCDVNGFLVFNKKCSIYLTLIIIRFDLCVMMWKIWKKKSIIT